MPLLNKQTQEHNIVLSILINNNPVSMTSIFLNFANMLTASYKHMCVAYRQSFFFLNYSQPFSPKPSTPPHTCLHEGSKTRSLIPSWWIADGKTCCSWKACVWFRSLYYENITAYTTEKLHMTHDRMIAQFWVKILIKS